MSPLPHPAAYGAVGGYTENPLRLPGKDPVFAYGTLKSGVSYKAGSVLGLVTAGSAEASAKSGGNTGNGTCVPDVSTPVLGGAKSGRYKATFTTTTNIRLERPDGVVLGDYAIGGSTGNSATLIEHVKAVITQGATPFAAGDAFNIDVEVAGETLALAAALATDGSAEPVGILPEDVDATGGAKNCGYFAEGYFNETALIFGAGHTADTVRTALRAKGIYIRTMKYSG